MGILKNCVHIILDHTNGVPESAGVAHTLMLECLPSVLPRNIVVGSVSLDIS